jgi:signal transduction histidine kinase
MDLNQNPRQNTKKLEGDMAQMYAFPEQSEHTGQRILLAERIRIAQGLHDTLLQELISASMQLQITLESLLMDSPAKPPLTRVLQLLKQAIEGGRNAVLRLRSSSGENLDLEHAFSEVIQEFGFQKQIAFRIVVVGRPRPLRSAVHEHVYLIGREALINAFRHADAKNIEVELDYDPRRLRVAVRDDGRGIAKRLLQSEPDKHWGLLGMRERSEKIGAKLRLWSRDMAGTEVELSVPARFAFGPY